MTGHCSSSERTTQRTANIFFQQNTQYRWYIKIFLRWLIILARFAILLRFSLESHTKRYLMLDRMWSFFLHSTSRFFPSKLSLFYSKFCKISSVQIVSSANLAQTNFQQMSSSWGFTSSTIKTIEAYKPIVLHQGLHRPTLSIWWMLFCRMWLYGVLMHIPKPCDFRINIFSFRSFGER